MNCKVCHYALSDHNIYQLGICLGYMSKGIDRIQYGIDKLETPGDLIASRVIEDAQNVLRD